ncbi:gamma-glutamyltransferase 1 [Mrakia frigida]|uniref:gamma-glutamyltransferase family protein n=1 Tax=Mrakia frigida TaxID=29902 RepID=UPI003FCC19E8
MQLISTLLLHLIPFLSSSHSTPKPTKGAVSSELKTCSDIGQSFLVKGGNAADAMVAMCACMGTIASYHSGIGGGGFALVRLPNGSYESIDFRGAAPAAMNSSLFIANPTFSTQVGGLAVTVPGELRGLEAIHSRHGKLPWSELFAPAVALARDGFEINQDLYRAMTTTIPGTKIPTDFVPYDEEPETSFASKPKSFLIEDPVYAPIFSKNGKLLPALSITTRPTYADTLETIAREGPGALYSGKLANQTVDAIKAKGGLMTLADLEAYSVHIRPAVSLKYRNHTVRSCQAPSSGSIILSILNTMSGYEVEHSDVNNHRIVEAQKFGYGQRTNLGDPQFLHNITTLSKKFHHPATGEMIRSRIDDEKTREPEWYNPEQYDVLSDPGTSALVAADESGLVISLTTTVNLYWGSRIMVPESGIVLNDGIDDFSIEGRTNAFGFHPSPANYIMGGKRPLSSMSPVIVEDPKGNFLFTSSCAGGSRIINAQSQIVRNVIDFGMTALQALAFPRLHDQIYPLFTTLERDQPELNFTGFSDADALALLDRGHNVSFVPVGYSVAAAVKYTEELGWEAAGDPRRVNSGGSVSL